MARTDSSDTPDRKTVADHLYKERGAKEASDRCDANSKYGAVDLCEEMLRHSGMGPGSVVFDVGCGSGQHLVRYAEVVGAGGSARGFDFSPEAVENTRKRGIDAEVASSDKLPVGDASADVITCAYSIYYMPDLDATISEWARVLRPGGKTVISGPADDTNKDLYDFHREVTGRGPADVDVLSLGYVQNRVPDALQKHGFAESRIEIMTNPIAFPTVDEFVHYWTSTSLFARGVEEDQRQATIDKGRQLLATRPGPYTVTKRVAIAVGVR